MSPEDMALCQQAIDLAQSGQRRAAYEQFCSIHNHGNPEDVTLLYWIAVTTPSREEAQRAIDTVARIEPDHPELPALRAYLDRKRQEQKQWQQPLTQTYIAPSPTIAPSSLGAPPRESPLPPTQLNTGSGCKTFVIIALAVATGIVIAVFVLAMLADPSFWQGFCQGANLCAPPTPTPSYYLPPSYYTPAP